MRYKIYSIGELPLLKIYSIGYSSDINETTFGPSKRNLFLIGYVLSGNGIYNKRELHAGQGFLVTPDIIEYIDKHCYEKITLSQIAQKCFYTPSYFSHAFKKYCGKSLSEYVKKKRITYALELLGNTDYTVSQISEMVGYNDKTFFYKVFREAVGKSPAEYRNSLK